MLTAADAVAMAPTTIDVEAGVLPMSRVGVVVVVKELAASWTTGVVRSCPVTLKTWIFHLTPLAPVGVIVTTPLSSPVALAVHIAKRPLEPKSVTVPVRIQCLSQVSPPIVSEIPRSVIPVLYTDATTMIKSFVFTSKVPVLSEATLEAEISLSSNVGVERAIIVDLRSVC